MSKGARALPRSREKDVPLILGNCFHCKYAVVCVKYLLTDGLYISTNPRITVEFSGCWVRDDIIEPISGKKCIEDTKGARLKGRHFSPGVYATQRWDLFFRKYVNGDQVKIFEGGLKK